MRLNLSEDVNVFRKPMREPGINKSYLIETATMDEHAKVRCAVRPFLWLQEIRQNKTLGVASVMPFIISRPQG